MTIRLVILGSLLLVLPLLGCSSEKSKGTPDGNPGIAGKYVKEKNPKSYLELKPDGTFFWQDGREGNAGKYEIESNQITLNTNAGPAVRGKIDAKTIIFGNRGSEDRWTKP